MQKKCYVRGKEGLQDRKERDGHDERGQHSRKVGHTEDEGGFQVGEREHEKKEAFDKEHIA